MIKLEWFSEKEKKQEFQILFNVWIHILKWF